MARVQRENLKPTNDVTFKRVFEDKTIVLDFINAAFKRQLVEEIDHVITEYRSFLLRADDKICMADVYCKSRTGDFIVEIQLSNDGWFDYHMVYNTSKRFCEQFESSYKYSQIRPVYMITVCSFDFLQNRDWYMHHKVLNYTVLEENLGRTLTEEMLQCDFRVYEYIVLQLGKFDDSTLDIGKPDIEFWMTYFKRPYHLSVGERTLIKEKKTAVNLALEALNSMTLSEDEWNAYEHTEECKRLLATALEVRRKREEDLKRREEDTKRREENTKRREEDTKRREENTKRIEEDLKRREEDMKRIEENTKRIEEDLKRREEDTKRREENTKRREENTKRREEDLKRREEDMKRIEKDTKRRVAEPVRMNEETKTF